MKPFSDDHYASLERQAELKHSPPRISPVRCDSCREDRCNGYTSIFATPPRKYVNNPLFYTESYRHAMIRRFQESQKLTSSSPLVDRLNRCVQSLDEAVLELDRKYKFRREFQKRSYSPHYIKPCYCTYNPLIECNCNYCKNPLLCERRRSEVLCTPPRTNICHHHHHYIISPDKSIKRKLFD